MATSQGRESTWQTLRIVPLVGACSFAAKIQNNLTQRRKVAKIAKETNEFI
jgi:hypothetical protein